MRTGRYSATSRPAPGVADGRSIDAGEAEMDEVTSDSATDRAGTDFGTDPKVSGLEDTDEVEEGAAIVSVVFSKTGTEGETGAGTGVEAEDLDVNVNSNGPIAKVVDGLEIEGATEVGAGDGRMEGAMAGGGRAEGAASIVLRSGNGPS